MVIYIYTILIQCLTLIYLYKPLGPLQIVFYTDVFFFFLVWALSPPIGENAVKFQLTLFFRVHVIKWS